jgi:hypothetical protein
MSRRYWGPRYAGALGKIVEKCKVPAQYDLAPTHRCPFDDISEGFFFLILVAENRDSIVEAVRDNVEIGAEVISDLKRLKQNVLDLASVFEGLSGRVEDIADEVIKDVEMRERELRSS